MRYADDFLILTKTQADAERALTIAQTWLVANGLSIQSEKTSITSFEKGFSFLGVSFLGDNQWATDPQAALWVLPPAFRPISEVTQSMKPAFKSHAPKSKVDEAVALLQNRSQIENAQRESETMNLPHQEEGTLVEDYDAPPLFRSIYLTEPGIYINKDGGRIRLNRGDEKLLDVPIEKIDQIVVTNEGAISFGALRALTDSQCSLVVHGLPGAPLVTLQDAKQTQVELQHAQHLLIHNHERRISAARQIVKGKIKNQRLVLQRYFRVRGGLSKEVDIAMRNAVESANHCDTLDELRGHEGIAARAYFGALGVLLESSGFKFVGRQKRMAADPINELLSYCYGVLFQNILTLIHRRGLCPYTGCLHSLRQGHAALVSDLMEEFRPIVADSCVLRLIMQGRCKPSHFDLDDAFVKIPLELRKLLIQTLEDKLDQRLDVGNAEKPIDLRRRMQMQVNHWVDYLRGDASTYTPYM